MNLEITLVKSNGVYDKAFDFLNRTRIQINTDEEAMSALLAFIQDNLDTIDAAMKDKAFVTQLSSVKSLTVDTYYQIKYILASNGIDVLACIVADGELNPTEIADGTMEFTIIDNLDTRGQFLRFGTKCVLNENGYKLSDLYTKINAMYGLFEADVFSGVNNPVKRNLVSLERSESGLGTSPTPITNYLNSLIEYLGKELCLIQN